MPEARGLLLDIGGVVLENGAVMVNRLADRHPAVAGLVSGWGGLAGPDDLDWHRMLAGEITERAFWEHRSEQLLAVLPDDGVVEHDVAAGAGATRALMRRLYDGDPDGYLRADVLALMREVREAGIVLGALTNDMADFHGKAWVDAQYWVPWFDVVVDASHTGVLKPDPRAFAAGAAALGLPPSEVAYLDDMPWNVDGGAAAGLRAIRVDHHDAGPAIAQARHLLGLT